MVKSELDEGVVHAERTARGVAIRTVDRAGARTEQARGGRARVGGGSQRTAVGGGAGGRTGADVVAGGPGEHACEEGTANAVLSRGARVDVEIFTSAHGVVVRQTVASTVGALARNVQAAAEIRVGAQRDFSAQVTTQLDAGVSAGDVVETRTVQGAD